ncbi:MAG: hypothetical protein C0516_00550 [Gemmatimonas sp.]|uniref:DEAD/DEAH box helicase n=1 Tax=Gemmatimonas sp. UBA7669 TaxID=1946568 RepID=UPI0025C43B48|nr:DEAD/DEAH box helicase [Gemmatimonas sp. UBA7669]MBA3917055.1 hypothetical protein [Gemmatimonas sp.]
MPSPVISRYFSAPSSERGEAIARGSAVRLLEISDTLAVAEVDGSETYFVEVAVTKKRAELGCSCPHADDGNFCKHLWATLRLLERSTSAAALNAALNNATSVRLVPVAWTEEGFEVPEDEDDTFDDDGYELVEDVEVPSSGLRSHQRAPYPTVQPAVPLWHSVIDRATWAMRAEQEARIARQTTRTARNSWPDDRRIVYVIDASVVSFGPLHVLIEVMTERRGRDGTWSTPKKFGFTTEVWLTAPDPRDQLVARALLGVSPIPGYGNARATFTVGQHAIGALLPLLNATGQLRVRLAGSPPEYRDAQYVAESADEPWRVVVSVGERTSAYALSASLVRSNQRRALSDALWIHPAGLCLFDDQLSHVDWKQQWALASPLWDLHQIPVGDNPAPLLERIFAMPQVPTLELPSDWQIETVQTAPVPGVRFVPDPEPWRRYNAGPMVAVQLAFRYGQTEVGVDDAVTTCFDAPSRRLIHRDPESERAAVVRLQQLGISAPRQARPYGGMTAAPMLLARTGMRRLAQQLASEGWWVEADGRAFRAPGAVQARVRSGIDWFDLDGTVSYGDLQVPLVDVLEAKRRGDDLLTLPDGGVGLLPDEWLRSLGPLLASGERQAQSTRFRRSQLALLDALLASLPEVDVDAVYTQQRDALRRFERVAPATPPPSFVGALRPYQQDGLGWMHFLRQFGFGGCLADDMGLGKTVQVLALLESRRVDGCGPSLVVVPRSLVFNWRSEAARFAPSLRVVDWSSAARHDSSFDAEGVDVALVTYGTLRRDAVHLAEIAFDYVILDEAQAIKNQGTATAKACRVLQASHRLAMTGTPVENRLEELWSLIDFLNPGMLGHSARFISSLRQGSAEPGVSDALSRALRPVIMRRSKTDVAPELPARIERTLEVEMEPKQRAFYEQLRKKVRAEVLATVESQGLAKSKLHVLEGLLRLRQAACHPVLADPRKSALPSAKLDALLPTLVEVAAEGHKALVFSQFTSLLALVRNALDAAGIAYEYLDGRTKDRQARVQRFQQEKDLPVFLISLKAGGHGLNLTAADFVYLLDPWWNPAVEAQAIDRAHRIGRTRPVVATRLVARDTIEEKILALQANKRALADAILSGDRGGLASIGREELELLLS